VISTRLRDSPRAKEVISSACAGSKRPRMGWTEYLGGLDGMGTESNQLDGTTWKTWKPASGGGVASCCRITPSGFPYKPLAMCKLAKLSFVAGAELPKRYVVTS